MLARLSELLRRLESTSPQRLTQIFWVTLTALSLLQLTLLLFSPLDLAPDEAHYWEWSRRLDWNYYSKGPVVALLIAASTALLGDTAEAVRLPAFLLSFLLSIAFFYFVKREYGAARALGAWLLLRVTVYFATLGLVITTDPPVLVCWFGWLWCALRAVRDEKPDYWAFSGILLGAAVLSKYTAIILYPSTVLFLLLTPSKRHQLRSLGFVLGTVLLGISLVPALWWNMNHGWVSFAHNAGHLGAQKQLGLKPAFLGEFIGGQAGLVGPLLVVLLAVVCVKGWRSWREGDAVSGLLLSTVLPLAGVCLALSMVKRVYVNWPMPMYLGAVLLAVHLFRSRRLSDRANSWIARGFALNCLMTVLAFLAISGLSFGLPAEMLPMKKLVGWQELGQAIQVQLDAAGAEKPFIITDDYGVASEIAFYTPSHPQVFCSTIDDRRMNQYDVWGGLEEQKGRTALIVRKGNDAGSVYAGQFNSITQVGVPLTIYYGDSALREFYFFRGQGFTPPQQARPSRY